ncbi:MAG: ComF family protein [Erysipelotrichaceae bacterium]
MEALCRICMKDLNCGLGLFQYLLQRDCVCGDCRQQFQISKQPITRLDIAIDYCYQYDETIENLLYQFKEARDVALAPVFLRPFCKQIEQRYQGYTIVFVPSSSSKTIDRGFLPLRLLFEEVNLVKIEVFDKAESYQQKKKNRSKRVEIHDAITCRKTQIPERVLLVDDVVTTGNTIRTCYDQLADKQATVRVFAITVKK